MINIEKILFFDIETVPISRDLESLKKDYPRMGGLWKKYADWFRDRYRDKTDADDGEIFKDKAGLLPEFSKIICLSVGFVDKNGDHKLQSFYGDDESEILKDTCDLFDKVDKMGFHLCGHNIKRFDMVVLGKRYFINGMRPPNILPKHDTKPWEYKAIDMLEVWGFGSGGGFSSLELVAASMDIKSPKDDIDGSMVGQVYWDKGDIESIKNYCEKDVEATIDVMKKIINCYDN